MSFMKQQNKKKAQTGSENMSNCYLDDYVLNSMLRTEKPKPKKTNKLEVKS